MTIQIEDPRVEFVISNKNWKKRTIWYVNGKTSWMWIKCINTWLSRRGWGYLCWRAALTRYVIASTPHSLMRMWGCWQTSSKWFVSGLHRTSTLGKFTKPVSKSFATAKREGSWKLEELQLSFKISVKVKFYCWVFLPVEPTFNYWQIKRSFKTGINFYPILCSFQSRRK